jgi:hypothetical protein
MIDKCDEAVGALRPTGSVFDAARRAPQPPYGSAVVSFFHVEECRSEASVR